VLKDIDLVNYVRNHDSHLINLTLENRNVIIKQLERDTFFLESKGLMDYSLLLAIEEIRKDDQEENSANLRGSINDTQNNFLEVLGSNSYGKL